MAAPSYTTDLVTYNDCTSSSGWGEVTNLSLGAGPDTDSDLAIHGTVCITQDRAKVGGNSQVFTGTGPTLPTNGAFFVWHKFFAPNSLQTLANDGAMVMIGSTTSNCHGWDMDGSDTYEYGGWVNYVVDPTITHDWVVGTPSGVYNTVGNGWVLVTAPQKGNPFNTDIIRYGRGESRFTDGDSGNGYATFNGYALVNDNPTTGRFGLIQEIKGGYLYKGLMSLGLTATSVDFRDSDVNISIDDTTKVVAAFNRIEVHNASSNIEWTGINITALGVQSKGEFEMVDNATVALTGCKFADMSTFIFQSNATLTSTSFQRCGQITHGGADFSLCDFTGYEGTTDTAYLTYATASDPDGEMDYCKFVKGTASTHAIEYDATNTPTTITLRGIDFTGYNATNGNTDSALYFPSTTKDYIVYLVECTGDISYKVGTGGSVTLIADPVTTTVTVRDATTSDLIAGARVLIWVTDATNFPYLASVTITGSGTTATVTHAAHGLATGDNVNIQGSEQENYRGAYQITVTDVNTYTYTTAETVITTPATGTIVSTFCFINELTDALGVASDSRVVNSAQPIQGRIRKSTTPPYYQQGTITDTVSSTTGYTATVQLIEN